MAKSWGVFLYEFPVYLQGKTFCRHHASLTLYAIITVIYEDSSWSWQFVQIIIHDLYLLPRCHESMIFASLALCDGNPPVTGGALTFLRVSFNKMLNKQSNCRWVETPWLWNSWRYVSIFELFPPSKPLSELTMTWSTDTTRLNELNIAYIQEEWNFCSTNIIKCTFEQKCRESETQTFGSGINPGILF